MTNRPRARFRSRVRRARLAVLAVVLTAANSSAATFTVTNADDSGTGSFRQAITSAAMNADTDTIVFDPSLAGRVINLLSPLPAISQDIVINSTAASGLTIANASLSNAAMRTVTLLGNPTLTNANIVGNTSFGAASNPFVGGTITGNLSVSGNGVLDSAVVVTGQTTIASGAQLRVGGTLNGAVSVLGTGILESGGVITGNAQVDSTGSLRVSGTLNGNANISGTGIVDSSGIISGNTTVASAGSLAVAGIVNGTTSIVSGGSLSGNGTLSGDTTTNGSLSAGSATGDIDTLNFGNNLTIGGGTVRVDINAAGVAPGANNDLYDVTNNTTITGGTVAVNALNGAYASGMTYTFLTSGGTVTGTFAGISDNFAFFDAVLVYGANNVSLRLDDSGTTIADVATTCNQVSIGNYLESLRGTATGDLSDVIAALRSSTIQAAQTGLDQLGGQIFPSLVSAQLQQTTFTMAMLRDQLILDAFYRPTSAPARGWIRGYGAGGDADEDDCGTRGFNYRLGGTEIALQRGFGNNLDLGLFTNLSRSEIETTGIAQGADVDSYQFGGSSQYVGERFYLLGIGGFGYQQMQTHRSIQMPGGTGNRVARSNFDGSESFGLFEVGRIIGDNTTIWGPYASAQFISLDQDQIKESGADSVNLNGEAIEAESLRSVLGLSVQQTAPTSLGQATTKLKLGWMHEYLDTRENFVSSFAGQTERVTIGGIDLGSDWAVLGANLQWSVFRYTTLLAGYQGLVNTTQSLHTGALGLEARW